MKWKQKHTKRGVFNKYEWVRKGLLESWLQFVYRKSNDDDDDVAGNFASVQKAHFTRVIRNFK